MIIKSIKNILIVFFWRLSRKILSISKNENIKHQNKNGEFWLINEIVKLSEKDDKDIFIDIGAFQGEWSFYLQKCLDKENLKKNIYLFEPSPPLYNKLKQSTKNFKKINVFNLAFFSIKKNIPFFYNEHWDGTNSFEYDINKKKINVITNTIDDFLKKNDIKKIRFIKCDVEGFDFEVIKGAQKSFDRELIDFFQFEYNHRWIHNRAFLRDVFNFFDKKNYVIGKLCHNKIKVISRWHPELEKFNETNFVVLNQNFFNDKFCYNVVFNKFNVMIYE